MNIEGDILPEKDEKQYIGEVAKIEEKVVPLVLPVEKENIRQRTVRILCKISCLVWMYMY